MIRARITKGERTLMALGLSGENVTRLAAGEPIWKQMDDAGFSGIDLLIVYGTTEEQAGSQIKALVEALK